MSQGKRNYYMYGVRLDFGSEVLLEYRLKNVRAFKSWNLSEIDAFWAFFEHTAT